MGAMRWIVGAGIGVSLVGFGFLAKAASRSRARGAAGQGLWGLGSPTGSGGSTPSSSVYVRNRVIYGPGGFRYALTQDDLLWLGSALVGEAGTDNLTAWAAVAWATVQYHAIVLGSNGQRPVFSSFTSLLRAYCQPINPKWESASTSSCHQHPERCTEALIQRRAQIRSLAWERLPEGVRQTISSLGAGALTNPVPGMTDWAAFSWQARSQVRLINIRGNKFGVGLHRRLYRG